MDGKLRNSSAKADEIMGHSWGWTLVGRYSYFLVVVYTMYILVLLSTTFASAAPLSVSLNSTYSLQSLLMLLYDTTGLPGTRPAPPCVFEQYSYTVL